MKRTLLTAVAAALALLAGGAMAATSTVNMTLTVTPTDLNVSDGIDPSAVAITEQETVYFSMNGCCGGPVPWEHGFMTFAPFDHTGPYGDLDVQTTDHGVSVSAWNESVAGGFAEAFADYILTPYTSVDIVFNMTLSATAGHGSASAQTCFQSDIVCDSFGTGAGTDFHSISYTFVNDTPEYGSVYLEAYISAIATGVPEPSTLALMVMGAGFLVCRPKRA